MFSGYKSSQMVPRQSQSMIKVRSRNHGRSRKNHKKSNSFNLFNRFEMKNYSSIQRALAFLKHKNPRFLQNKDLVFFDEEN